MTTVRPNERKLNQVLEVLKQADRVSCCGHARPDGDCVGSQIGLRGLLANYDTDVYMMCPDPVPERFRFLEGTEDFAQEPPEPTTSTAVLMDCGNINRTGPLKDYLLSRDTLINLDHHPQDDPPGELDYVDPELSCVGELVYYMYQVAGFEPDSDACRALYVSLLTDTGGFRHSNTQSQCHRVAADLLELGQLEANTIYKQLYERESLGATRALGVILASAQSEDGLVWSQVRRQDLEEIGVEPHEINGAVELLRQIDSCEVAILFWEQDSDVKINFRSKHDFDLLDTVHELGGGGHDRAAGATMEGSLDDVREKVLSVFLEQLNPDQQPTTST